MKNFVHAILCAYGAFELAALTVIGRYPYP